MIHALLAVVVAAAVSAQTGLRIVVIEGEGAVNIIQQKTATAPIVEVRDHNNLPVAGAVVRFSIGGGNQAAFAGGSQTFTVTTNAAGRAMAGALNPMTGGSVQIHVQAAFQGQTAAATIAQTNVMTAAQAAQATAATGASGGGGGVGAGTIAGVAGGAAAAAGAALLVSKQEEETEQNVSGGVQSVTPDIDPAVTAALGTYALQTVNGAGLPAVMISSPPASCQVVVDSASLTLSATAGARELLFEATEHSRTECRLGPSQSFRSTVGGAWSIAGGIIAFQNRSDNMILDNGTLNGSTITLTFRPPHIDAGREAPRVNSTWRK